MQSFQIHYRNTQGTLMRILNAASRRGLDLTAMQTQAVEHDYQITLALDANPKQVGQLYREWYSITDVTHVRSIAVPAAPWANPHRPAGVTHEEARAAARA